MKINISSKYLKIREQTVLLCSHLSAEDNNLQINSDVSPNKWHLGHTTWFFEIFILKKFIKSYIPFSENYLLLFNSYYDNFGIQIDKNSRQIYSRPSFNEILNYRKIIDQRIIKLLNETENPEIIEILELGLNHEQQHQELILIDTKLNLFSNHIFKPIYFEKHFEINSTPKELNFIKIDAGLYDIGHSGSDFSFDNELPKHKFYTDDFYISNRLITNQEYLEFIESADYNNPNLWHSDGWVWKNKNQITMPLYWIKENGNYLEYTLRGIYDLNPYLPVTHISYYEAWAFSKFSGGRLATEFEYEIASQKFPNRDNFFNNLEHSSMIGESSAYNQFCGTAWEWTESYYLPYPNFIKKVDALGEYNAKFFVNNIVLRGGSCLTPESHFRNTYRNFFSPEKRWMVSGIRLVRVNG